MTTLGPITISKIISALPPEVVSAFKSSGIRFYLGGGFLRAIVANEKPSDVDLFVGGQDDADALARFFSTRAERYEAQSDNPVLNGCLGGNERRKASVHRSPNAITIRGLGRCVQIITRWTYTSPAAVVSDFDFTLSQAALWWGGEGEADPFADAFGGPGWLTCVADTFESDVLSRRLVYTQPQREEERAGSLVRLFKFFKRGYTPDLDTVAKVCARAFAYDNGDIDAILYRSTLEQAARRMPKAPVPGDYSEDDTDVATEGVGGFSAGS